MHVISQQGKRIDANLELENKTWMCCLSTHSTTFDHWPEKRDGLRVCLKSNSAWVQLTRTLAANLMPRNSYSKYWSVQIPKEKESALCQVWNLMLAKSMRWISQENFSVNFFVYFLAWICRCYCHLRPWTREEIGYFINPPYWGKHLRTNLVFKLDYKFSFLEKVANILRLLRQSYPSKTTHTSCL